MLHISRKYELFFMIRRWKKTAHFETLFINKDRIEGCYFLLRRFKNRLKQFDDVIKKISETKAGKVEIEEVKMLTNPNRA